MDRSNKLKALKAKRVPKVAIEKAVLEPILDAFQKKIEQLKDTLGVGVEITNLDDLLEQLSLVQSFQKEVKDLKEAIKSFKLPDDIKVSGLEQLVEAIKALGERKEPVIQKIDISVLDQLVDGVGALIGKIDELKAPDISRAPSDFMPVRRVVKIGNQFIFDDNPTTASRSGGGGSGTSVSVSNFPATQPTEDPIYKKLIDDTTTTSVTYIGEAALGTATATASWRIKKVDESASPTSITWSGVGFNVKWTERATVVSYS